MADEFTISRIFKAPRQKVWDAWTKPELLVQWFGPKGTRATAVTADIRVGGVLHSYMDAPDGRRLWAKFVYRELWPPSRLVYEHSFSDPEANIAGSPFSPNWPKVLLTTVTFEEEGADTRMRLHQVPLRANAAQRAEFVATIKSMHGGWSGSFDELDELIATG